MSLRFGTNNYVYIPHYDVFDTLTNALTITCWVNISSATSMQMFVNRATSASPTNEWWSLNTFAQAMRGLIGDATSVTNVQATTPTALDVASWYHGALTFDGSKILLYQLGQQIGSGTRTLTFPADSTGVVIGANASTANDGGLTEFATGYLEDLRVYNRVLSQSELQTIVACEGRDGIVDNLLFRLPMSEQAEGTVASGVDSIVDCGPYGVHGTPYGHCVYGPSVYNLCRS